MADMVDWELAVNTATQLVRGGPTVSYEEAAEVVGELRTAADRAEEQVIRFTGLSPDTGGLGHAPVRVVDRPAWARANVAGFRAVLTPVAEKLQSVRGGPPSPLVTAVGSRVTGVQLGGVLAFLASKVLGQYEVFGGGPGVPGELLLVAPNVVAAERALAVDPHDFRLWVCLHEVTHRTQFTAVPWLREHFLGEVRAFVDASDPDAMRERLQGAISAVASAIRERDTDLSIIDLVQTPAQKAVLDRLTALMTLVEGHAEYVMDGVGPDVVPTVSTIRARFQQRRKGVGPVDRVIRRLLGIDVKMRQYAEGNRFVGAVVDQVGMAGFNKVWTSAQTLPSKEEIAAPKAWVARVVEAADVADPTNSTEPTE